MEALKWAGLAILALFALRYFNSVSASASASVDSQPYGQPYGFDGRWGAGMLYSPGGAYVYADGGNVPVPIMGLADYRGGFSRTWHPRPGYRG